MIFMVVGTIIKLLIASINEVGGWEEVWSGEVLKMVLG